ncbi:MAG: hypothetical protein ABIF92_02045 [archaeon]
MKGKMPEERNNLERGMIKVLNAFQIRTKGILKRKEIPPIKREDVDNLLKRDETLRTYPAKVLAELHTRGFITRIRRGVYRITEEGDGYIKEILKGEK